MSRLVRATLVAAMVFVCSSCSSTLDKVPEYFSTLPTSPAGGPLNQTVVAPNAPTALPRYDGYEQRDIDMTRYLNLVDGWGHGAQRPGNADGLTDLYMRVVIKSHVPEAGVLVANTAVPTAARQYGRERSGPERLVIGRSRSLALQANVQVTGQSGFNTNVPLIAASYHANKDDAETWITDIASDVVASPYFRVDPRATMSVTAKLTLAEEVSSTAVKVLLTLAREIAQIAVPQSALVTTLTKDKLDQQAKTLDNAIGNLFSLSVAEGRVNARDLINWDPSRGFLITLHFPDLKETPTGGLRYFHLGTWSVNLSFPRPSVFSKVEIVCDPSQRSCDQIRQTGIALAFKEVTPESILNSTIAENLTIEQYLMRQDWFSQAVGLDNNFLSNPNQARQFCDKVVNSLFGLGLNSMDAHAGLWAVLATQPIKSDTRAALRSGACKAQFTRLGQYMGSNARFAEVW